MEAGDRRSERELRADPRLDLGQTPTEVLTNSSVHDSAGAGVYRGWRGTAVDFLATNTFANIAGCLQTNVPYASNACSPTACPVQ